MANNIVQLKDYNDNNVYPIAGAAVQGSITKTMLDEGVFVGAELSDPGNIAYVGTSDIQDNAVTTAKIADLNVTEGKLASNSVTASKIADGSVTSDKIDWTTINQTITDTSGRTGIYFDDGTLIAYRSITGTVDITTAWGSLYRGQILSSGTGTSFTPSSREDFIEKPKVSIRVGATSNTTFMVAPWTNSDPTVSSTTGKWGLPPGSIALVRPTSASSVPFSVDIIAIGRWK